MPRDVVPNCNAVTSTTGHLARLASRAERRGHGAGGEDVLVVVRDSDAEAPAVLGVLRLQEGVQDEADFDIVFGSILERILQACERQKLGFRARGLQFLRILAVAR